MLTASSGVAAMVTSPAQSIVTDAQVDLERLGNYTDISNYISAWSFSRDLTTDVPDGARLVTGYSAAELTLTGIGNPNDNTQNGAWYWSTYNRTGIGPLSGTESRIGTPIRVHAGYQLSTGVEVLSRFVGTLRSINVDGAAGTAALDALDGSDKMRQQCNIPMMLGDYKQANYSNGAVRQGLNGGHVIDYLFRANGFYSTPPPRSQCVLSVPTHGSLEPDYVVNTASGTYTQFGSTIYAYDGPWDSANTTTAGAGVVSYIQDTHLDPRTNKPKSKFGQCVDPIIGLSAGWNMSSNFTLGPSAHYTIEGWVDLSNPLGIASGSRLITFNLNMQGSPGVNLEVGFMGDSRPFICYFTGSTVTGTAVSSGSRTWIYVLINVQISSAGTTASAAFTLNSTAPTTGNGRLISTSCTLGGSPTTAGFEIYGDKTLSTGAVCRWEGLQVTTEASGVAIPATNVFFNPSAFIEPSLNRIRVVPFSADQTDSWAAVQEIAACEFGVVFFDEQGIATFWNRNHIVAQPSAVATVTSQRQLTALTESESIDSVKNHIVATITPYQVQAAGYVYSLAHTIGVHSKSTYSYTAQFDNPAVGIQTTMIYIPLGDPSGPESGYRACRTPDGTGNLVSNLQITVTPFAQSAKISIFNPNNFPVYLICPQNDNSGNAYPTTSANQPFLRLYGFPIIQSLSPTTTASGSDATTTSTVEVMDGSSVALYGEQEYDLPTSGYLQSADSVTDTLNDMLGQLCRPFPVLQNVSIVADPRLQIGDRIRLQDPEGTLLDNDAYIVGIDEALDPTSGYTQGLTLRAIGGPDAFTIGDPVKGVLDDGYVIGGLF